MLDFSDMFKRRGFLASLCTFFSVGAYAQIGQPTVPMQTPFSNSIPNNPKPFLKERKRLEKGLIPPGAGNQIVPESNSTTEAEAEVESAEKENLNDKTPPGNELGLPGLSLLQSNTGKEALNGKKNTESSWQSDYKLMPIFESVPPSGVGGYLGQTLVLSASAKEKKDHPTDTFFAWILNGEIICQTAECVLPLDGKKIKAGTSTLLVLVYNAFGSSQSRHILQVIQSKWSVGQKISDKFKKIIPAEKFPLSVAPVKPLLPSAYMVSGNALQSYPDVLNLFGSVPRNTLWQGRFKTANSSVLRLQDPQSGDWFLLGKTEASLNSIPEAPRVLKLNRGGLRLRGGSSDQKATKDSKKLMDNVRVQTEEFMVTPGVNSDLCILRVSPNAALLEKRKGNKTGEPLPIKEQFSSRLVVIAGTARIDILSAEKEKSNSVTLPPGVEFIVYEDGTVLPLGRPNAVRMERLMKLTLSLEEISDRVKVKKELPADLNLPAYLEKIEKTLEAEDYFDSLALLSQVENRSTEDVRIPYYFGLSQRGIYRSSEAEKSFKKALLQDTNFALAPWQLAQMKLEEKKYAEAQFYFDEAEGRMTSDNKLHPEYQYYSGVVRFNQGSEFLARNAFTRALWEQNLDAALKQSAGRFLNSFGKHKKWTFVSPLGIQFEKNGLGLTQNEPVPEGFAGRSLARLIAGGIFTYDNSVGQAESGLYWGGGAKAIYLKNFPKSFSSLNALVLEASASQTLLSIEKNPDGKGEPLSGITKFSEIYSPLYLAGKIYTHTVTLDISKGKTEGSLGLELDAQEKGKDSKSAFVLKQVFDLDLPLSALEGLSVDFEANERAVFRKSSTNGNQLTLSASPSISRQVTPRVSSKFGILTGVQYTFLRPLVSQYKLSPNVSLNAFITPWLLGIVQISDEFSVYRPANRRVVKPMVSLMLTGIF